MPTDGAPVDGAALTSRVPFAGLQFDALTLDDAVARLAARDEDAPFGYVVTPNVDHVARLQRGDAALRAVYAGAVLCLNDSRILTRLAAALGVWLPPVPGSDLTPALLTRAAAERQEVLVVGGKAGDAERLRGLYAGLVVRQLMPPMGLRHDAGARAEVAAAVASAGARYILLAVGSPQQEMIAALVAQDPAARGTALCIGASIDFLVGVQRRAPRAVQRIGMEWAWRLASEPRRMWRRYLIDGPVALAAIVRDERRLRRDEARNRSQISSH